jgi:hypothetical protein
MKLSIITERFNSFQRYPSEQERVDSPWRMMQHRETPKVREGGSAVPKVTNPFKRLRERRKSSILLHNLMSQRA